MCLLDYDGNVKRDLALSGDEEMVRIMLGRGTDVTMKEHYGRDALYLMVSNCQETVANRKYSGHNDERRIQSACSVFGIVRRSRDHSPFATRIWWAIGRYLNLPRIQYTARRIRTGALAGRLFAPRARGQ